MRACVRACVCVCVCARERALDKLICLNYFDSMFSAPVWIFYFFIFFKQIIKYTLFII